MNTQAEQAFWAAMWAKITASRIAARDQGHRIGPGVRKTVPGRLVWPRTNGTLVHPKLPATITAHSRHQVEMFARRLRQNMRTSHAV